MKFRWQSIAIVFLLVFNIFMMIFFVLKDNIVALNKVDVSTILYSYAPTSYNVYTFSQKELNVNDLNNIGMPEVDKIIYNYRTIDNKLMDIVIFKKGLSIEQQAVLSSLYSNKKIDAVEKMPLQAERQEGH